MPTSELDRHAAGAVIRALRISLAISSRELAELVGMTTTQMSRTENGLRALMLDEAVEFAKVFGLKIEDFAALVVYESQKGQAFYLKMKGIEEEQVRLLREAIRG